MEKIKINDWNLIRPTGLIDYWISGEEIGYRLGYADPIKGVEDICTRHQNKFQEGDDYSYIDLVDVARVKKIKIFSEGGALKVVHYSNMAIAHQVRDDIFRIYLDVFRLPISETFIEELPGLKAMEFDDSVAEAFEICVGFVDVAIKLGATRAQAHKKAVAEVKQSTGVDFAFIFGLNTKMPVSDVQTKIVPVVVQEKADVVQAQKEKDFAELLKAWYQCFEGKPMTAERIKVYLKKEVVDLKRRDNLDEAIIKVTANKAFDDYLQLNRGRTSDGYCLYGHWEDKSETVIKEGVAWQVFPQNRALYASFA